MNKFQEKLDLLSARGRYRSLMLPGGVDLTSNDYLGMRDHPALRKAALSAIESDMALGSSGSRLLRGHMAEHAALEDFAATHFGVDAALYFATGYQANYALFTTLPDRHDIVIFDALVHASARDGIQAMRAKTMKVAHNDLSGFEEALKKARAQVGAQHNVFVTVEAVYSMDGDQAPVEELQKLAAQYEAYLIVDEAHATGVLGDKGRGLAYGLNYDRLIMLHTCGKAIGVAGGLVCGPAHIIEYLINAARPFIYSTAPMPLQAFLVQKSLEILASDEGDERRARLRNICAYAQQKLGGEGSHIVPMIIGEDVRAVEIASALQQEGYDVRAIRPPTVPEGTARLRLSLNSELSADVIDDVSGLLARFAG